MKTASRPRVAHVIGSYHNFTGSQRSTHLFLQHIDRDRYDVCVVAPGEGECLEHFRGLGIPVIVEPAPPPLDQFQRALLRLRFGQKVAVGVRGLLPYTVRLARRFRSLGVSLVHTADLRGQLLAAPAAHLAGVRVVAHFRGEFGGMPRGYVVAGAGLADRMILVSPNVWRVIPHVFRGRCVEIADPVVRPATGRMHVRAEVLRDLREPLQLHEQDTLVVSVGTLVPQKGAHRLIEALHAANTRVQQGTPSCRIALVFAGKMPDDAYLRFVRRTAREGALDVRFLGWVPDEVVDRLYRVADVACFPGVQLEELDIDGVRTVVRCLDALPRAVTEPMSYGVPVVATRVAGIERAIEDGKTGVLVPPSDPDALADAILRLVRNPALRRRLGQAAATSIFGTCSIGTHVDQITRVYDDMLLATARTGASRQSIGVAP